MGVCCSKGEVLQIQKNVKKGLAVAVKKNPAPTPVKKVPVNKAAELRAAILIQKWFRKWKSKLQARRELTWRIFQKVEYLGERNQMILNKFFRILIDEFSNTSAEPKTEMKPVSKPVEDSVQLTKIPADVGVNISPPFSVENLQGLINFLRTGKILETNCVINLLIMTTEKLKTKSNFYEVSTSVTQKITIVGDLHGNLDDLLTIFFKNDIPSVCNPYIFNGDMVDRGKKSVEVAMILCYCFLLFPNHVHLNRGNHEDPNMNEKYGFVKEIKTKYRNFTKKIFNLFKNLYRQLPLGTIIDRKIFVTHGGISNITDLNIIADIERYNFHSIIKPPRDVVQSNLEDWEQVTDILWSDPTNENGCAENESRGGGKCFGPDVTEKFLKKHNLELLIRSHECKPEGYEYGHSGKILTVFSSSNYYHPGSNKGAYLIYTGDVKKIRHVQFVCSDLSMKNVNFQDKVVSLEEKAITDLKRMLFTYRSQLMKRFMDLDANSTRTVPINQYVQVLSDVLAMNLPWRLIQPKISKKDKNNNVLYETTFEHTKNIQDESASEILFSNLEVLETIFRAIDKDNSGCITMAEFSDAMDLLKKHSDLDTDDIRDLGELIDLDHDGYIDIDEFFEAFKISRC